MVIELTFNNTGVKPIDDKNVGTWLIGNTTNNKQMEPTKVILNDPIIPFEIPFNVGLFATLSIIGVNFSNIHSIFFILSPLLFLIHIV